MTADTVKAWINERRRIHNAATAGPWAKEQDEAWGANYSSLSIQRVGESWDSDPAHACCDPLGDEDATAIVDAHASLPGLLAAVEKVLELHKPWSLDDQSPVYCSACLDENSDLEFYPCPNVRAIEGAANE